MIGYRGNPIRHLQKKPRGSQIPQLGSASQINHDIASWLRAADEQVAVSRLFERLRRIRNCSRNQAAFAVVTNSSPARPTHRDVTRLSKLQNALVLRPAPVCGDAAACERHEWALIGIVLRQVRSCRRRTRYARGPGLAAVKDLDVDPLPRHAQLGKYLFHLGHKTRWPTEVNIRILRHANTLENRLRQVPRSIEILTCFFA